MCRRPRTPASSRAGAARRATHRTRGRSRWTNARPLRWLASISGGLLASCCPEPISKAEPLFQRVAAQQPIEPEERPALEAGRRVIAELVARLALALRPPLLSRLPAHQLPGALSRTPGLP